MERVLSILKPNTTMNANRIARKSRLGWPTTKRVLDVILTIQDFLAANRIVVVKGSPRNTILLQIRVRVSQLPAEVADWFIRSAYFREKGAKYTTEEVLSHVAPEGKVKKTPLGVSIRRVVEALRLEDEISVLELSKRTALNRRTAERVLALLTRFQDDIAESMLTETGDGGYLMEPRPDLYRLDSNRMIYLLKRMYLPEEVQDISDRKGRELLRLE
ncbi:MAG: hypothetical protein ACP6KW_08315 [Candidatus Thorarchaeota archaeon]